jgi:hypothetical protein
VPAVIFGLPLLLWFLTLVTGQVALATVSLALQAVMLFAAFGSAVFDALKRPRDAVARAQTLWLVFGLLVSLGIQLPVYLLGYAGTINISSNDWVYNLLGFVTALALPLSLGIAITRYRLFDIELIIRKALVYALLSGLLTFVYFGSVVLLQNIFNLVTGDRSPVIIVVSTLLIAALFTPLRRRLQDFIDRRFFRQKYDAQQVLAQFAQTARDETDMEALQMELERVVQETMQPESVLIWLRDSHERGALR